MVEELLKTYDLLHCSIITGGKVDFEVNYYGEKNVEINVFGTINDRISKKSFEFIVDDYYETFILPKMTERFLTKNLGISLKKGKDGRLELRRVDGATNMLISNCPSNHAVVIERLINSFKKINDFSKENKLSFIDYSNSDLYVLTNIISDIAYYNTKFRKSVSLLSLKNYHDIEEHMNTSPEKNIRNELILNIAKFVASFKSKSDNDLWEDVLHRFHDDPVIAEIIEQFKKETYEKTSVYTKALEYAEYENINSYVINNNEEAFEEATVACINDINFFEEEYLDYWRERKIYYQTILDKARITMCDNFINNYYLKDVKDIGESNFVEKLKSLKKETVENTFFQIFNDPIVEEKNYEIENESVFEDIKVGALDQAKQLVEIIKERDALERDAEEFAKEILKSNKEYDVLKKDAEKQAEMIMELQKENIMLKQMAEENAKFLIKRNRIIEDEEELRNFMRTYPVKMQDVNKINNLMASISEVKKIDFAISHPTIMNYLIILEEKIVTYLSTHTNVIKEQDIIMPIEKEEMYETKSVVELLSMIRNAYDTSKILVKEGRKSLININPVDEDTYRLVLYSIKDEEEEVLMDAFFEDYQLTDEVLEDICNIFKEGTVIVASKIDSLPFNMADYLIIDNLNNALKFMGCSKELIERAKKYI